MFDPSNLGNTAAYLAWRAAKLADFPENINALRVEIVHLADPSPAELKAVGERLARCNLALIACPDPRQIDAGALLAFGRRLGLDRTDSNLCADERAVSAICVRPTGRPTDYVPYTNRPLTWHTDGYYNAPDQTIRAWTLFCARNATTGGENALFDPEIAYIRLRDEDPALVAALMEPNAMSIPANVEGGVELRPSRMGPVFSVAGGHLHMRYSARTRNILWKQSPALDAARKALTRLLSTSSVYMFQHNLKPGEGYVSNNVLHNRTGFTDTTGTGRLLLRVRYLDRAQVRPE
jgi:hypothetical protein